MTADALGSGRGEGGRYEVPVLTFGRLLAAIARRLPGRGRELDLIPLHGLQVTRLGAVLDCVGEHEDPQFGLHPRPGDALPAPGWYLLDLRFDVREGDIVAPCLYPDYGDGYGEASRIEIAEPSRTHERVRTVVLINQPLLALRFDPTQCVATFRLSGFRLRRISRPRAVLEMLLGIGASTRSWFNGELAAAAALFLAPVLQGRVGAGADALKQRYRSALRREASSYRQWIARFDERASAARVEMQPSTDAPTISLVVPVKDPPLRWLRRCLDSVLAQSYRHWQLCLVDDDSSDPAVKRLLRDYALRDRRICVQFRERHGHICEASNDGIDLARGEWIGFLDHDDELAPDALTEVARAIALHPQAQLLYSDEDKIDENGRRYDPHFKPAWNPDLLRSLNYVCHFAVARAALIREAGKLRPGFEGAQDHDLMLRCAERLRDEQVVHIPKVLYHWRAVPGSTALSRQGKPYALEAGRRAVEEHMARIGLPARVEVTANGYYRCLRKLAVPPKVSVIVPTRDRVSLLRTCVAGVLERTRYPDYELLILDNGSAEPETVAYLREIALDPRVSVVDCAGPFNFSAIVNRGVRASRGQVLCLLNNDTEVIGENWLEELATHATREDVGVVGCMLYYPTQTIQHAGVILGLGGVAGHLHMHLGRGSHGYAGRASVVHGLSAVTGACMAVRRSVFDEVGGMDESLAVTFNDIDLCLRIDALGYRNLWTPFAELYHHESASRGRDDTPEKRARFETESQTMRARWGGVLLSDWAYNPNLTLDGWQCELAFPPRSLSSRASRPRRAFTSMAISS